MVQAIKIYIWWLAPMSIEQLLEDCTLLVQQTKQKANMVVLSNIPLSDDDDGLAVDEKIKEVNETFKKVAEKGILV